MVATKGEKRKGDKDKGKRNFFFSFLMFTERKNGKRTECEPQTLDGAYISGRNGANGAPS